MKKLCLTKVIVLSSLIALNCTNITFAAIKFKDVSASNWAISYINYVYDKGIMLGDTSGYFRPNDLLDKFQASKIIARIAGFKYKDLTKSEEDYINKAYEKNKVFLSQYEKAFKKWSTTANKEIAYLLDKKIFIPEDLNSFVIKTAEGIERMRALSKEEVAMFIVKAIGKQEQALNTTYNFVYSDDKDINNAYKPYVYYLEQKEVFTPDKSKKFYPKNGVTRAIMATILEKTLNKSDSYDIPDNTTPLGYLDKDVSNQDSLVGTVDKYYDPIDALQIIDEIGNKSLYVFEKDAKVYIDGDEKTPSDLEQGYKIKANVKDDKITVLNAYSNEEPAKSEASVTGVVKEVSEDTIGIQVNQINSKGEATHVTKNYTINKSCKIERDGKKISVDDIAIEDIVEAGVKGNDVYSIKLYNKYTTIKGKIKDKQIDSKTNNTILVITSNNKDYSLQITDKTKLTRKGLGEINSSKLRIGDDIEAKVEQNNILDLYAVGETTSEEGILENIFISKNSSTASIRETSGLKTYRISSDIDVYSLRIGSTVSIKLDSLEIYEIKLIKQPSNENVTASVKSIKPSSIVVIDNSTNNQKEVKITDKTVFINSYNGVVIDYSSLKIKSLVYIIFESSSSNTAKTVTVLS